MSERKFTPRTITRAKYYQLLGLEAIARRHLAAMKEIEAAATRITEPDEKDFGGSLTSDYLWGSRDLTELLKLLKIEVADGE